MSEYYDKFCKLTSKQKSRLFEIENDSSFDNSEDICCPYCSHQQSIEPTDVSYEDGDDNEHTCLSDDCGKKFIITTSVNYSWSTQVPDEEAMEILEQELLNEQ